MGPKVGGFFMNNVKWAFQPPPPVRLGLIKLPANLRLVSTSGPGPVRRGTAPCGCCRPASSMTTGRGRARNRFINIPDRTLSHIPSALFPYYLLSFLKRLCYLSIYYIIFIDLTKVKMKRAKRLILTY